MVFFPYVTAVSINLVGNGNKALANSIILFLTSVANCLANSPTNAPASFFKVSNPAAISSLIVFYIVYKSVIVFSGAASAGEVAATTYLFFPMLTSFIRIAAF